MNLKAATLISSALIAGAVGISGCATKDFVREQVALVDGRVTTVDRKVDTAQSHLEQDDTRLAGLDQTSRDALERAKAAGKLAEGKFLYAMVLSDDSVKFPVSRANLSPEAEARLTEFVEKLKSENKNVYLEVQGHTDSRGAPEFNHRLGQDRAEAVRLFMNRHGVALNRMSTISYGADAPAAPNTTRQGRAQNRRVVLIVLV
jgi:outer membrane protein OmpA-like peptidoglycan-associated protein